jgi:hypothetical protein
MQANMIPMLSCPQETTIAAIITETGWQRRIVGHGGCGARLIRHATRLDSDWPGESLVCCHRHGIFLVLLHNPV